MKKQVILTAESHTQTHSGLESGATKYSRKWGWNTALTTGGYLKAWEYRLDEPSGPFVDPNSGSGKKKHRMTAVQQA